MKEILRNGNKGRVSNGPAFFIGVLQITAMYLESESGFRTCDIVFSIGQILFRGFAFFAHFFT